MSDARELACDAVVVGIGLIPNDELARDAGLECDAAVVVDAQCRTSDPDIPCRRRRGRLACGWAAPHALGVLAETLRSKASLPGVLPSASKVDHQPLPWFWSDQYDTNLQIYGMPDPSHRVVVRGELQSDSFVLFYLDGDKVQIGHGAERRA